MNIEEEIRSEIVDIRRTLRKLKKGLGEIKLRKQKEFLKKVGNFYYIRKIDWVDRIVNAYGIIVDIEEEYLKAWEIEIIEDYHFEIRIQHASVEYFKQQKEISRKEFLKYFEEFNISIIKELKIGEIR